jgi:hypothetical protein
MVSDFNIDAGLGGTGIREDLLAVGRCFER